MVVSPNSGIENDIVVAGLKGLGYGLERLWIVGIRLSVIDIDEQLDVSCSPI